MAKHKLQGEVLAGAPAELGRSHEGFEGVEQSVDPLFWPGAVLGRLLEAGEDLY